MAQALDNVLLAGLQEHMNLERRASATYWAMAIWFDERDLRGFAQYLHQESLGEQQHATEFADYLVARGQTVQLAPLPAPRQNWSSPLDIFATAFQLETDVTTSLQQLYEGAERAGDVRTTVFLDPIVHRQIAAEDQTAHLLGRIRFSQGQPAPLLILDAELRNESPQPGSAVGG
ncbi:ferritin [Cyanobium sp. Morenito 9A2]|nr:ferritin [Cyanobium sp. Morenito 9A2]MCP9848431.1 ferritin [Cyanobium sp. Morenito 9A2]